MIDYLYYKLYKAFLRSSLKDIPHLVASASLGALVGVNVIIISAFLAKIDLAPFLFKDSKLGGWLNALLILAALLYYNKRKRELVLEKYSQESEAHRRTGNAIVWLYVILSFILIFVVAFYKPGKV